tara:strand:+ start:3009 stop:3236 length:228 start_codon:yes stop_codon:yes gene_type:complete
MMLLIYWKASATIFESLKITESKMTKFIHQKRYAERQKDRRKQVQVKVWVMEEHREELLSHAKKLRNPRYVSESS